MKVLLYFEDEQLIRKSGVGRAFEHQKRALASAGKTGVPSGSTPSENKEEPA